MAVAFVGAVVLMVGVGPGFVLDLAPGAVATVESAEGWQALKASAEATSIRVTRLTRDETLCVS